MNRYNKNNQSHNLKSISTQNKMNTIINEERRRAIDISIQNNLNKRVDQITKANQKLLGRLLEISERKHTPAIHTQKHKGRDLARIMKMKSIQAENIRLGTRLMTKGSTYDHSKMHKQMRSYERLKKMMINNRKACNDRLLIPGSLRNPYDSGSRRAIRKMKTEPIQEHIKSESRVMQETVQRSRSKNNVSSSDIAIQIDKTDNNQQEIAQSRGQAKYQESKEK